MNKWRTTLKKYRMRVDNLFSLRKWGSPKEIVTVLSGVFLFALLLALGLFFQDKLNAIVTQAQDHYILGVIVYILFLAASVVIAPLTSLPIVPFAGKAWGIAWAGAFSVVGWWFGSILAFLFVRWFGRPFLAHFISFKKIDAWEKKIPKDITFLGVVLAQLVLPAAIPSFGLGLSKKLSFTVFATASLLGIAPTTFLLVAAGGAFLSRDWILFVGSAVGLLILIAGVSVFWKKYYKQRG